MENLTMTVQLGPPLRQRLEAMALSERRKLEDQALCLIEDGIEVFEEKALENKEEKRYER
jgi:hypothetical protein